MTHVVVDVTHEDERSLKTRVRQAITSTGQRT
jgi:hypothetical protein